MGSITFCFCLQDKRTKNRNRKFFFEFLMQEKHYVMDYTPEEHNPN